eukprot:TRINITY_DN4462_c1_g1_i1.p2 TRINITY_DN4462_c1_g1~~TRINITY_DN4462_c1_g1_i1.p2  ORF type:complete len:50 (-),score=1.28 TRINITY_DN4462_c1_g1_i1:298-447(-)
MISFSCFFGIVTRTTGSIRGLTKKRFWVYTYIWKSNCGNGIVNLWRYQI